MTQTITDGLTAGLENAGESVLPDLEKQSAAEYTDKAIVYAVEEFEHSEKRLL